MSARAPHILIVTARFYRDLADCMLADAQAHIAAAGGTSEIVDVPGAFEIPAAIGFTVPEEEGASPAFDGYVALGCVIRGETSHYDYVCGESARGLQDLAVHYRLAIGYGILTVENRRQAWARARPAKGPGKGVDAAEACLAMIALRERLAPSEDR